MPVPRHAWWCGERGDVATTGALTGDVAGSTACIDHGAALTRHGPQRGRTWTQTEDQPQLLSVRIGSDATMDPGFTS